ncbi:hypothetical protein HTG_00090 [Natrinema mahii]|nr:hypothetical protein HTG_00090 [Natrinema mahii]
MKNISNTTESDESVDQQSDATQSTEKCVGCGHSPLKQDTAVSYHPADDQGPSLVSGYLCSVCQQHVEAILKGSQSDQCSKCGSPLAQSRHFDLREYDDEGHIVDILSCCWRCLRNDD